MGWDRGISKCGDTYLNGRVKRSVDIVISGPLLVLSFPAVALLATWSTLAFRAKPLIRQERVGRGSESFGMLKIRTLPASTPGQLGRSSLEAECSPGIVAKVVRGTHLDELPQLYNVLRGQMSLVGPRPMIHQIVSYLDPEFAKLRHSVRPGLTGLWQVSEHGRRQIGRVDYFDIQYLRTGSLKSDFRILALTAAQTLGAQPIPAASATAWIPPFCPEAEPVGDLRNHQAVERQARHEDDRSYVDVLANSARNT